MRKNFGDKEVKIMDTSTPLKKLCLKQSECPLSIEDNVGCSVVTKHDSNQVSSNELFDYDGLFSDPKFTDINTSVEVFPVSPISCLKNGSSNLLPLLDSSNLKWSSSLHTSYAENETVETIDQTCTPGDFITDENGPHSELNEIDVHIFDESHPVINTPYADCSPVFAAARIKRRKKNEKPLDEHLTAEICSVRKSLSSVLETNESEDTEALQRIRCLNEHALEFDDSYSKSFNICTPSENPTSKTKLYSLNFKIDSKKFVYPLASDSIKKPPSFLPVDQLTKSALSFESHNLRGDLQSRNPRNATKAETTSTEFIGRKIIAFNELYEDKIKKTIFNSVLTCETERKAVVVNCECFCSPYPKNFRTFVKTMFACKNNDRDTIQVRFNKIADYFAKDYCSGDGARTRASITCFLYSTYYFLSNVNLRSFRNDYVYKHGAIQNLIHRILNSFKYVMSFDSARDLFGRFESDIYALEKMGVPVPMLYVTNSKTFRCLPNRSDLKMNSEYSKPKPKIIANSVTNEDKLAMVAHVLKYDHKRNVAGDKLDFTSYSGFCTASGNRLNVPEKTINRFVDKYSDIIYGQPSNENFLDDVKLRQNKCNNAFIKSSNINTMPSSSHNRCTFRNVRAKPIPNAKHLFSDILSEAELDFNYDHKGILEERDKNLTLGFKTCSGRTINIDDKSMQASKNLFSDIASETEYNFDRDCDTAHKKSDEIAVPSFKTSSGKTINIDNKMLLKSKSIFSDIADLTECNFDGNCKGGFKKCNDVTALGFKTCSGKTINIDNKLLQKSKNFFSDISDEAKGNFDSHCSSVSGEFAPSYFKTCSGKTINENSDLLQKSRYPSSKVSKQTGNIDSGGNSAFKKLSNITASDFKTCSGRAITFNDELLQKSRNLLSDISDEAECNFEGNWDSTFKKPTQGFKTCTEKTIKVDSKFSRMSAEIFSNASVQTECNVGDSREELRKKSGETVTLRTDKTINVSSSDESTNPLAGICASPKKEMCAAISAIPSKDKQENGQVEVKHEHESSISDQNQSFDLFREITESTSAFLYDISSEQSGSSFFIPNDSTMNASARSLTENQKNSEVSDVKIESRSTSPVFDTKYAPSKRKSSTRKSGGAQSLNITFVRKVNTSDCAREQRDNSSDQICAELETLKMNFSFKSSKRKSSSLEDSQVASKKSKNSSKTSPSSQNNNEQSSQSNSRAAAATLQERYISNKPKEFCRPTRGYYSTLINEATESDKKCRGECDNFAAVSSKGCRISLGQLARCEKPKFYSFDEYLKFGLLPTVIRTDSTNARHFTFTSQFFSNEQLKNGTNSAILFGDAVPVIFNAKNEISVEEVARGFLASPGVDPKLISHQWIANHYRWIIWKLVSTERFFPKSLGGRYLTLSNVLFQLKFKYEQEIDRCNRSALKRILEGDDSPARPLVLCVALIEKGTHPINEYKVELTDGWYSIFAQIDEEMNNLIARKRLLTGSKLIISGAELVGLREPCDPLQIGENVYLKFSTNSCRRVRWDTRLGFYNRELTPVNRIQTILPKGGLISHLKAVIARVYPLLFLEKYDNASADVPANASWSRLHNEKVEIKKTMAYERDRQNFIESILSQVTTEVLKENGKTFADGLTNSPNSHDNERLRDVIQQRLQSRLPVKFSKNRHVSRLLKLRLVDMQDVKNKASAVLTIWNPCEDVTNFFKEGRSYNFFNVNANYFRNGELQLSSTRSSKYDACRASDNKDLWYRRCVRSADDLNDRGKDHDKSFAFDEVDVVGVIIKVQPQRQNTNYEQNGRIYVADLQQRFFALSFRIDPKNFEFGDSIENGKIVAGLNLQWKKGWLCWKIPILYVSELSSFVQSTNIAPLQSNIDEIHRHFRHNNLETFVAECKVKLNDIVDSMTDTSSSVSDNSCHNSSSLSTTTIPPLAETDSPDQNKSDKQTTFKNAKVGSKYEKLQSYGRPPALSPIVLTSQSKVKAKLPVLRRSFKL